MELNAEKRSLYTANEVTTSSDCGVEEQSELFLPPFLYPNQVAIDGLTFIGLCLTRRSEEGHSQSMTMQTAFDFNEVQDRTYKYIATTNDDGWLLGGGEPSDSPKLPAKDSGHIEIMRLGTFDAALGGISFLDIDNLLMSGKILIPQMAVLPTAVQASAHTPPELEVRFDLLKTDGRDGSAEELANWQLLFLHNQLFQHLSFPAAFCPGAFHMTIVRKAVFRSTAHKRRYFDRCQAAISRWREAGPKLLTVEGMEADAQAGGVYIFRNRNDILKYYPPNFFPLYNTPESSVIIAKVLGDHWNEAEVMFK